MAFTQRATFGSTSSGIRKPFASAQPRPCVARAPVSRTGRQALVVRAGLFDFLTPKPAAPAVNPRAQELAEALIDICSGTDSGSKASPVAKAEIEELVGELAQFSVKNPLKSPLLWGTYEVLYCSKPTAVGGPLKKGAGPVIAPGQRAVQILEEPDSLVNEVTFKTLGFIPGFTRQYGQIQPISGDTFVLSIKEGELNAGFGTQQQQFDVTRKIQILYLDDTLRIARFLPSDDLTDQESEESQGGPEAEEILFVFQRVAEEAAEDEEEEEPEEEPEEERAASPVLGLFGGGTRKIESIATQVERQVESQRTRKGTQAFFLGGRGRDAAEEEEEEEEVEDPRAARQRERAEAQARKQREQEERRAAADKARQEAAAAKAAEQARAAKDKEAEAKARAAQEARARAEAEKAERAERAVAIREQLAELAEELKEKQAAARAALKEVREVQRDNQGVLKQVAAAEAAISEAEEEVQQVSAALEEAGADRKAAEQQLKQALQAVKNAEAAYKQKVAAR